MGYFAYWYNSTVSTTCSNTLCNIGREQPLSVDKNPFPATQLHLRPFIVIDVWLDATYKHNSSITETYKTEALWFQTIV